MKDYIKRLNSLLSYRKSLESEARNSFVAINKLIHEELDKLSKLEKLSTESEQKRLSLYERTNSSSPELVLRQYRYEDELKSGIQEKGRIIQSLEIRRENLSEKLNETTKNKKIVKKYKDKLVAKEIKNQTRKTAINLDYMSMLKTDSKKRESEN